MNEADKDFRALVQKIISAQYDLSKVKTEMELLKEIQAELEMVKPLADRDDFINPDVKGSALALAMAYKAVIEIKHENRFRQ